MSKHGHSHSGGDDDDDDHGSHGHSHNGQPCHGHGAPQPKREVHGHSHNGQPCHGHGAPKGEGSAPGAHGHSHGPGGHGHSHAPVQHGHSHNGQPCHGHGENEMTEAQRKQLIMAWMQRQQQLQQQQQGQHNHSHSGGDHGHSHGDHGHSHGDHGHSHGAPRQLPPPNIKQCAVCKKEQDLLKCAGCQSVAYCSREHQKEHWKAVHKPMCAALAAARAAGEHSGGGGGGENKQMQDIKVVHTIRGKALTINRMNDHGRTLCHMMQSGPIPEDWTTEACWCEEKTSKQTNVVAVSFPASALTALKAAFERDNNNASMLSPTKYELRSEPFKLAAAPEGAGVDVSSYSFELVLQVATGRNGEGMLLCLVAPKAVQKDGKIDYTSTKGVVFRGSVFMVNPEGAIEIPKFGMPQPSPAFLGVTCGCEEQSLVGVMPMSEERNAVLIYTKPEVAKAARTAAETVALTEELKDAKKAEAAAQAAVDKAWSSLGWAELKDDKFVTLVLVMEVLNTVDGDDAVEHTYFRTRQHNLHIQESPEATVPAAMTALVDDAKAAASAWACFNKNKWPVQFVAAVPNSEALKQK